MAVARIPSYPAADTAVHLGAPFTDPRYSDALPLSTSIAGWLRSDWPTNRAADGVPRALSLERRVGVVSTFPSMKALPAFRVVLAVSVACFAASRGAADVHVVVSARANPAYAERKFAGPEMKPEGYVFGAGSFFGGITADRSLERTKFREVAEALAPELARQQYWPAKDLAHADLLIVVHWGVTTPHQSMRDALDITTLSFDPRDTPHAETTAADQLLKAPDAEGQGDPSPAAIAASQREYELAPSFETIKAFSDEAARNFSEASNAQLLGYTKALRQLGTKAFGSAEEDTLRADLSTERYLVILCAYDVRTPVSPGQKRRPVWVAHLNVRAAGTNFSIALHRMGQVGSNFFGRNTDNPTTVRAKLREGHAIAGELIILGTEEPTPPKKTK
jgi:hypothetical protein